MKIIRNLLVVLVALLSFIALFVACEKECEHQWMDATCEVAKTCSLCNATEDKAIGHIWTDATCTTPKICAICDKTDGKSLGHTEVVDAAVAPTCTATGLTEGKYCSVCNEVLVAQETVAALGHTEVVDAAVAPTCIATGLTEGKHCSVCNEVFVAQETVAALGHNYNEVVAKRTCATDPKVTYTCSVCSYSYEETVSEISITIEYTGTSYSSINGYNYYSKGYNIYINGGYGDVKAVLELYTSQSATIPSSTLNITDII